MFRNGSNGNGSNDNDANDTKDNLLMIEKKYPALQVLKWMMGIRAYFIKQRLHLQNHKPFRAYSDSFVRLEFAKV